MPDRKICTKPEKTAEDVNIKDQEKNQKKEKMMNEDPYASLWVGHKGRSAESYQIKKTESVSYGNYTTDGTPGDFDASTLEPSKLPKNMTAAAAKKLVSNTIVAMKKKNYIVYTDLHKLNIVSLRSSINVNKNKFSDWMIVFWWETNTTKDVKFKIYKITTVPGIDSRKGIDTNAKGAGWLIEKQFVDGFSIGLAKRNTNKAYDCLRSNNKQIAYRSIPNANGDLTKKLINGSIFLDGPMNHGMLIHKSSYLDPSSPEANRENKSIGSWSYGCQVFSKSLDFYEFMALCKKAKKTANQKKFTYTILIESDIK